MYTSLLTYMCKIIFNYIIDNYFSVIYNKIKVIIAQYVNNILTCYINNIRKEIIIIIIKNYKLTGRCHAVFFLVICCIHLSVIFLQSFDHR